MISSMTGYGGVSFAENGITVFVEIKTVNNRFLKVSLRTSESYSALESRIEAMVRESLLRGTVNLNLRVTREKSMSDYGINREVLESYVQQLRATAEKLGLSSEICLSELVALPGVTEEVLPEEDKTEKVWPVVKQAVQQVLDKLNNMRRCEGESMVIDLTENCMKLSELIQQIEKSAPNVVEQYRLKLTERVERIMTEHQMTVEPTDLIREVAIFADKSDISEEIVRFKSHLNQFEKTLKSVPSNEGHGRKLDFLTQEMFRETNTIGSKANDSNITNHVVQMKTTIERIREMVQNIE